MIWKTTQFMCRSITFACMFFVFIASASAQEKNWHHAVTKFDTPKYDAGFSHFDYVNPEAPKGGKLTLSPDGPSTFNTVNPVVDKGDLVRGLGLVFETLMVRSEDEPGSYYGLLAEAISYPEDISTATIRLNANARWEDGTPVTADDVVFSFDKFRELSPQFAQQYAHVAKVEKTGEREVTFTFDEKNNSDILFAICQINVVSKAWWEGKDADGNQRDITKTTLEPPMGSGPYRVARIDPGSRIVYELRDDYWAKDLNVNVGQHNFGSIEYLYFANRPAEFEAFRKGILDYWWEEKAQRWETGYDFPAMNDGRITRGIIENASRAEGVMAGFVPNMRRDIFKNEKVREALNYAFDFETTNRTVFYDAYTRVDSYFSGTELASSGLPEGGELEILNTVKDLVPASVFTEEYKNPVGGTPAKARQNLGVAFKLLREAGYELKGNALVDSKTGKQLSFEILTFQQNLDRLILPYIENLKKIGIDASLRVVDVSQYINRVRERDYDMIYFSWSESLTPGNELMNYWGSRSADANGSANFAGVADPAVDKLIRRAIFAKSREELVDAVHALDRVMLHHYYVIPSYRLAGDRIAYWKRISHPKELPYYSLGFPNVWWAVDQ